MLKPLLRVQKIDPAIVDIAEKRDMKHRNAFKLLDTRNGGAIGLEEVDGDRGVVVVELVDEENGVACEPTLYALAQPTSPHLILIQK